MTQKDYGGNMIYKKSGLKTSASSVGYYPGLKAFDDLSTDDTYTLDTDYTLKHIKLLMKTMIQSQWKLVIH